MQLITLVRCKSIFARNSGNTSCLFLECVVFYCRQALFVFDVYCLLFVERTKLSFRNINDDDYFVIRISLSDDHSKLSRRSRNTLLHIKFTIFTRGTCLCIVRKIVHSFTFFLIQSRFAQRNSSSIQLVSLTNMQSRERFLNKKLNNNNNSNFSEAHFIINCSIALLYGSLIHKYKNYYIAISLTISNCF
jgi:hypothetical protein